MAIELPALPYAENALEPHISARTLSFHYGKHHKAYVDKTNGLIKGTPHEGQSIESIVKAADRGPLFNNAAQVWNHTFFWSSMTPKGGGEPKGEVADMLKGSFGSLDKFKEEFKAGGVGQFGSGWVWLVREGDKLKVVKTPNAETPLTTSLVPLVTCDVWEHAYYLDYQNRRADFLQTFLDHLINWDFVAKNLKA